MKYYLFLLIVSSCLLQTTTSCVFVPKYTVYVANNLPPNTPPLLLHCASKNDDLGNHTLSINQEFRFAFCEQPLVTLFYCRFQWNGKNLPIDVFNASWKDNRCRYNHLCYYGARSDGIYFSVQYPSTEFYKLYSW